MAAITSPFFISNNTHTHTTSGYPKPKSISRYWDPVKSSAQEQHALTATTTTTATTTAPAAAAAPPPPPPPPPPPATTMTTEDLAAAARLYQLWNDAWCQRQNQDKKQNLDQTQGRDFILYPPDDDGDRDSDVTAPLSDIGLVSEVEEEGHKYEPVVDEAIITTTTKESGGHRRKRNITDCTVSAAAATAATAISGTAGRKSRSNTKNNMTGGKINKNNNTKNNKAKPTSPTRIILRVNLNPPKPQPQSSPEPPRSSSRGRSRSRPVTSRSDGSRPSSSSPSSGSRRDNKVASGRITKKNKNKKKDARGWLKLKEREGKGFLLFPFLLCFRGHQTCGYCTNTCIRRPPGINVLY